MGDEGEVGRFVGLDLLWGGGIAQSGGMGGMGVERRFWVGYEAVHAVSYFHPAFSAAMVGRGLTGWWNGYFAGRAAPLGQVSAPVVTALFFGFAPSMVARAVPKVWGRISPEEALAARLETAAEVLGELGSQGSVSDLARVTDALERSVDGLAFDGRALAAAWADVPRPSGLYGRLWLATSVLREHRGDGHVIAATEQGLTGLQAGVTHVAAGVVPRENIRTNRGWSEEEWASAEAGLVERGILRASGSLTDRGAALRQRIEETTDRLARESVAALPEPSWVIDVLTGLGRALADRDTIPFPNTIGVSRA